MEPLPPHKHPASSATAVSRDQLPNENRPPPQSSVPARLANMASQSSPTVPTTQNSDAAKSANKKRRHRGGKKKKNRRQSFIAPSDIGSTAYGSHAEDDSGLNDPFGQVLPEHHDDEDPHRRGSNTSPVRRRDFYHRRGNLSDESINSEALLDHRDQPAMRPRRESRLLPNIFSQLGGAASGGRSPAGRSGTDLHAEGKRRRLKSRESGTARSYSSDEDDEGMTDRTPLIASGIQRKGTDEGYGASRPRSRGSDASSSKKGRRRGNTFSASAGQSFVGAGAQYDVNNPPSRPASPDMDEGHPDVMVSNGDFLPRSLETRRTGLFGQESRDMLIDIDDDLERDRDAHSAPPSPRLRPDGLQRTRGMALGEGDVCFPADGLSELGEDEMERTRSNANRPRRRRRREWPQLWALDEWARDEKEARDGERRAKKINEPVLVGGRLRPRQSMWHRTEEDAPYRYTYFNEEFESTIHAQTISELVQPGGTFRELFIPDPPEIISSSESSESEDEPVPVSSPKQISNGAHLSTLISEVAKPTSSKETSGKNSAGSATPIKSSQTPPSKQSKAKRFGPRPTFWLDVLSPTDQEMRALCKTFGIHALTAEDIMMQEAREKVELFRNYYFINYRTFEQDPNSEDYLEPVNMYVCVFRHGIVTFHFSQIPHPANVRRRIRQLTDYLILSADWISYAIIDDITDVYQPLITSIEEEVDDIDELILDALQSTNELAGESSSAPPSLSKPGKDVSEKRSDAGNDNPSHPSSGIDVLRRIGECRKKTTSLYRLLGQKADVIKGFAKRCNEQWEVAPRSEIGLYLGDIQDHIITMSANLAHYETSLSRAHSNYLAQVNIRMGERQESTADILGKLTVIGTIVLPMNVICGMWGECYFFEAFRFLDGMCY
jgi:magnesium transporter